MDYPVVTIDPTPEDNSTFTTFSFLEGPGGLRPIINYYNRGATPVKKTDATKASETPAADDGLNFILRLRF